MGQGDSRHRRAEVFYAEDTDGDGKADRREVWYAGFARSNQQHRVNGLAWGLDNWLHVANGRRRRRDPLAGTSRGSGHPWFRLRFIPFTKALEPLNGRTSAGVSVTTGTTGSAATTAIRSGTIPTLAPPQTQSRSPVPRARSTCRRRGAAPVFPVSPTVERFNDFDRANRFTSACGPAIYRDVLLGSGVSGNAFTCERSTNLVSRQVLEAHGATFTSDRHRRAGLESSSPQPILVASGLRPHGPDGGSGLRTCTRFVIEHPEWIRRNGRRNWTSAPDRS